MTQRFLGFLLSLAVLMHAVFGCCAHHAHGIVGRHAESAAAEKAGAGCCRGHTHADHQVAGAPAPGCLAGGSTQQEPHHAPHPCSGGKCSFVTGKWLSDPELKQIGSAASAAGLPAAVMTAKVHLTSDLARDGGTPRFGPLRRHLVLAVLLV